MPANEEIAQHVSEESARRVRLGTPAVASGILYLLSAIIISASLRGAPTVGVLQGLEPALRGEAHPAVSPRAAEIKFESHQALGLIAGRALGAIAIGFLVLVLLFLLGATRFRRPQTNPSAGPLIMAGGALFAALTVGTEVLVAIRRHNFASGHDFSIHATNAVTHNTAVDVAAIVTPLAAIALVTGMIMCVVNAVRVGLLPRWMGMVGGVSAVLLLLPAPTLVLIPAFWLVAVGILLMERWPKGDPPAWRAGEARPWPSQAEMRAEQAEQRNGSAKRGPAKAERSSEDVAPDPSPRTGGASRKRRRKRSSRR